MGRDLLVSDEEECDLNAADIIDVMIFATFTSVATLASSIQQIHYATSWSTIKEAQFEQADRSMIHPGLAFGGAAQITDVVLFHIRKYISCLHLIVLTLSAIEFYCYNVMSLNILFWYVEFPSHSGIY